MADCVTDLILQIPARPGEGRGDHYLTRKNRFITVLHVTEIGIFVTFLWSATLWFTMRAIGYCRVSTENQIGDDAYGLDVQRESIRKYCQDNGLELARIYEDAGFSGSLEAPDRPGLRDLLVVVQARR